MEDPQCFYFATTSMILHLISRVGLTDRSADDAWLNTVPSAKRVSGHLLVQRPTDMFVQLAVLGILLVKGQGGILFGIYR